jgi:hypothetical protein
MESGKTYEDGSRRGTRSDEHRHCRTVVRPKRKLSRDLFRRCFVCEQGGHQKDRDGRRDQSDRE